MQIQKQKVKCKRIRKSQLLLFGSLLIFLSILIFSSDYITKLKKEVFSEMELEINGDSLSPDNIEEKLEDVPITNEIPKEDPVPVEKPKPIVKPIDYSKYYGVLEIPKIGLKRGFYNLGHRYNNISYIAKEAGADFVKTSTGFSTGGATPEDIKLMRETVGPDLGVKASGGVRSFADTEAVIANGATRIGASSSITICEGGVSSSNY